MAWAFEELSPCIKRRYIHGSNVTVAQFIIKAGCTVPLHSHPQEQITQVIDGVLELKVGDSKKTLASGDIVIIPPNIPHEVAAITDVFVVDVFSPRRTDWDQGADSYLRR